jgi:hypothetical protein
MNPTPGGSLVRTPDGKDLVIIRTFRAPIDDVWASITEPERTARWWGPWTGEAGTGRTIHYTMAFEQERMAEPDIAMDRARASRLTMRNMIVTYSPWTLLRLSQIPFGGTSWACSGTGS